MERLNKTYSVAGVIRDIKDGYLGMKALEQREYCWGKEEQTEWVDTILNSELWKIPSLTGAESKILAQNKKDGKEVYIIDLMDGLQRSTTLKMFAEDEFILASNIGIVIYEDENGEKQEYNPVGKKFSELPSDVRKKFMTTKISMDYYREITPEFRRKLFLKLNSGKPLKNSEKNKNRMNPNASDFIYKIISSDLFTQYVKSLPKQMAKFESMQQVLLVMNDNFNLSGKEIKDFSSKFVLEDTLKIEIESITEYLVDGFNQFKQSLLPDSLKNTDIEEIENTLDEKEYKKFIKPIEYMKKVNIPMVYKLARTAINDNINTLDFVKFLNSFFEKTPSDYKRCTGSGSADECNVKSRATIISDNYNKYFQNSKKDDVTAAENSIKENENIPVTEQKETINEVQETNQLEENKTQSQAITQAYKPTLLSLDSYNNEDFDNSFDLPSNILSACAESAKVAMF